MDIVSFIMELLTYFIVYSFIGWLLESVYKSILEKSWVNSGFLHGPFCPIYGIGALIMYLFLRDFKGNPFIVFCLGFVVLSVWEYIVGVMLEKIFKTKYWDYSNNKFNIQGRVCLLNSIFWGILGVLFINIFHPFVQAKLAIINIRYIYAFDIVVATCMLIDMIICSVKVLSMENKLKYVEELTQMMKEKLEEIKKFANVPDMDETKKKLQEILESLGEKREKQKRKLYLYARRIKKAFPTIKSENLIKLANQRVERIKKINNRKNV